MISSNKKLKVKVAEIVNMGVAITSRYNSSNNININRIRTLIRGRERKKIRKHLLRRLDLMQLARLSQTQARSKITLGKGSLRKQNMKIEEIMMTRRKLNAVIGLTAIILTRNANTSIQRKIVPSSLNVSLVKNASIYTQM